MAEKTFNRIFLVICILIFAFPSYSADKGNSDVKAPGKVTTPSVSPKPSPPIGMNLVQRDKRVFLVLTREAEMVEVFSGTQRLQAFKKGKEFDISDSILKTNESSLRFVCRDIDKNSYEKTLSVAQYTTILKPAAKPPSITLPSTPAPPKAPSTAPTPSVLTPTQPSPISPKKAVPPAASFAKPDSTEAPFLSIEKIHLKDETIRLVLRNTGKGKLDPKDYASGILSLNLGKEQKSLRLIQLDPKGELNLGKSVEFDTGIKMTERYAVRASISKVPGDTAKTAMLTPMTVLKPKTPALPTSNLAKTVPETLKPTIKFTAKAPEIEMKVPPETEVKMLKKTATSKITDKGPDLPDAGSERAPSQPFPDMAAQAPARPGPEFPAEITSVNCPAAVGSSLSIHGHDFGRNEGHVDIALPGASFSCEITEWGEEHIWCIIPISMGEAVGRTEKEAVVWLKPARIEPPDPGTLRLPGPGGSSETPYYYSGEEGPRSICTLRPMIPRIESFSRTEISPMQELTIDGSKFGDSQGELQFNVAGDRYPYVTRIISWNNTRIRMQLMDTMADPYGDSTDRLYSGEDRAAEITVENSSGNSDSADITFIPGDETDYPEVDLHTSRVNITRRTVSGQRQVLIQITVENRGSGETWRRIRIDLRGLDRAGWIESGISARQEKTYTFVYNDSYTGDDLAFDIVLDLNDDIPETDEWNNVCEHVTWRAVDTEKEDSCMRM